MLGFMVDCSFGLRLFYALNYDHWCKEWRVNLSVGEGGYKEWDYEGKFMILKDMKASLIKTTRPRPMF